MARRIPLAEAKKSGKASKKQPVEKGEEVVVDAPPGDRTFDIEVLDGSLPPQVAALAGFAPASPPAPAWSPIASEPSGGWSKPSTQSARPASVSWTRKELPRWRQGFWKAFPILAALLTLGVVVQVYLAGAAMWRAVPWDYHKVFVRAVEFIPVLMIVTAFIGGRRAAGWWSVGLFLAIGVQYGLASVYQGVNPSRGMQLLGALHVVNALFIFGVALLLTKRHSGWMNRRQAA